MTFWPTASVHKGEDLDFPRHVGVGTALASHKAVPRSRARVYPGPCSDCCIDFRSWATGDRL